MTNPSNDLQESASMTNPLVAKARKRVAELDPWHRDRVLFGELADALEGTHRLLDERGIPSDDLLPARVLNALRLTDQLRAP